MNFLNELLDFIKSAVELLHYSQNQIHRYKTYLAGDQIWQNFAAIRQINQSIDKNKIFDGLGVFNWLG